MRNQVYTKWDENTDEIEEFTLPAVNQTILDTLPATTPGMVFLDLADVWHAEETGEEISHERTHFTLEDGTHVLVAKFNRNQQYAIAWHPDEMEKSVKALEALRVVITNSNTNLVNEITKKLEQAAL